MTVFPEIFSWFCSATFSFLSDDEESRVVLRLFFFFLKKNFLLEDKGMDGQNLRVSVSLNSLLHKTTNWNSRSAPSGSFGLGTKQGEKVTLV